MKFLFLILILILTGCSVEKVERVGAEPPEVTIKSIDRFKVDFNTANGLVDIDLITEEDGQRIYNNCRKRETAKNCHYELELFLIKKRNAYQSMFESELKQMQEIEDYYSEFNIKNIDITRELTDEEMGIINEN